MKDSLSNCSKREKSRSLGTIAYDIDEMLRRYVPRGEEESRTLRRLREKYAEDGAVILTRDSNVHVTVSAWVTDETCDHVLFAYHKIYRSYAWLGGHADEERDLAAVALKEAEEESGIRACAAYPFPVSIELLSVPAHVKKGKSVPKHEHLNVAFWLVADRGAKICVCEEENSAVAWLPAHKLDEYVDEPSMLPVYRKINAVVHELHKQREDSMRRLSDLLLPWYRGNRRQLQWRDHPSAYATWVSEIMLQQTRVEAVKEYFARFLRELPDVRSLAECDDERLMKLWEGLGYYSRVRNMKKAAQIVTANYGGVLPDTVEELRKLPGVGDYTAGAIASIAFDKREPAVDGNVLRVLSRVRCDCRNIDDPHTKTAVKEELRAVYPKQGCGDFTQSLMETGALVCLPNGEPKCEICPLRSVCLAYRDQVWDQLPVRNEKAARRTENLTLVRILRNGSYVLRKRASKGLLAGQWELPNYAGTLTADELRRRLSEDGYEVADLRERSRHKHVFTHVEWHMMCWEATVRRCPEGTEFFSSRRLRESTAVPAAFAWALEDEEPITKD